MVRNTRFVCACAMATYIAFSPAIGIAKSTVVAAVGDRAIDIDNFGRINAAYYRGAQPEGRDYSDLAALGVKTVINLTSDDAEANERTDVERAGMSYVQIPMTTHTPPTAAQLARFLAVVNDPAQQPVYVHCVGGRHRTGVMTAVYRMSHDGWTSDQAFKEMKQYNFGADFLHPEFKNFVYNYHVALAAKTPVQTGATTAKILPQHVGPSDSARRPAATIATRKTRRA